MIGTVIAKRYRIDQVIGQGGMGVVYQATDLQTNRLVAVKMPPPSLARDTKFLQRFWREGKIMSRLHHPHVVQLLDWVQEGENYFLIMEYVDGPPLEAYLQQGPLPVNEAVRIALQICDGLGYIHRQGILHRDLKTRNVLMTGDRQAKISDFGIAGFMEEVRAGQTGVIGNVESMPPEVLQGGQKKATEQSDIYSLGVVCYQMLTGRAPFVADHPAAVARMHLEEKPPSLRALNPQVPPQLEKVILKALAKKPAQRYSSAEAFARELRRAANIPTPPPHVGAGGQRRLLIAVAGIAALLVVAIIAFTKIIPPPSSTTPTISSGTTIVVAGGGATKTPATQIDSTVTASPTTRVPPTSTAAPSATPLTLTPEPEKTVTPTPTPATVVAYPTPELVAPVNGKNFGAKSEISFQWKWDGNLQENEYFDVRIWRENNPHYGKTNTKSQTWNVTKLSDLGLSGPGTYHWSVAVIRRGADGKWEKDLSAESPSRTFIYSSEGGGSSGGGSKGGYPGP